MTLLFHYTFHIVSHYSAFCIARRAFKMKNLSSQNSRSFTARIMFYLTLNMILNSNPMQSRYLPKHHKNYRVTVENIKDNIELCKKLGGVIRCNSSSCRCTRLLFDFTIDSQVNKSRTNPDKRKNKTANMEIVTTKIKKENSEFTKNSETDKNSNNYNQAFSAEKTDHRRRSSSRMETNLISRSHHKKHSKSRN